MKHILKKGIAMLLATLCALNLTVVSFAEETVTSGTCGENVSWSFDEVTGTLTISGEGAIEEYIGWSGLGEKIKTLNIKDGITEICDFAFSDCTSLKTVYLPENLTKLGEFVFSGCTLLLNVEIPNGVVCIGDGAFYNCTSLEKVDIPDSVVTLGGLVFRDCMSLKEVKLSENITRIEQQTFLNCTSLYKINIPPKLISIGDFSFRECTSLESISLPSGLIRIEGAAFTDCKLLSDIKIPDSVSFIAPQAFDNTGFYNNLANWENDVLYIGNHLIVAKTTVEGEYSIKEGTVNVASYAFADCSLLANVIVPESVKSFGFSVFLNTEFRTNEDNWENNFFYAGNHLIHAASSLAGECNIKEDTKSIAAFAFTHKEKIESIIIPESVRIINENAFENCYGLKSVTIPLSVEIIGAGAFTGCNNLTTTNYAGTEEQWNTISIGADNEVLTENIVFNYKETITGTCGENAIWSFDEASGKLTISGYGEMNDYAINNNSIPYYYPVPWADYKPYVKSIDISSGITYIGMNTFRDCTEVTELVIPEGVSKIGTSAFGGCKKLYSLKIPESITAIDSSAFLNSQEIKEVYYAGSFEKWNAISFASKESNPLRYEGKLYFNGDLVEDLIIPDGIKEINENVFSNNSCITSVTIPESVESIGENAFISSDKLEVTYYTGTEEQWNEIAIASGNDALTRNVVFNYGKPTDGCGENATWNFDEASGTITVSGTGTVSDYSGWKDIANIVTYVEIGNGITSVGEGAFNGFTALKEVYLAESVTELGADAFKDCSKLAIVTALSDALNFSNAFSGNDSRLFFVAKSNSATYQALKAAGYTVNGVSTDREKNGQKVLAFDGKTTVYKNLDYNYISNLIADDSDAHYLYFDKVTFEGIAPDIIIVDEENLDSAEEYFTLNEVYISVFVNGKTVTLPELVELLQKENVDGIISFEQKDEPTIFEIISSFFNEVFEDFVEEANRVIISVINAIKRLFRR